MRSTSPRLTADRSVRERPRSESASLTGRTTGNWTTGNWPTGDRPTGDRHRPLVVTADDELLDLVLRSCAAAGPEPLVAHDVVSARHAWARAPAVVVGSDLLEEAVRADPPRRRGLVAVTLEPPTGDGWAAALRLGAERLLRLPADADAFGAALAVVAEPEVDPAPVLAVVGAAGGAGASTTAAALALVAAQRRPPVMLLDGDPLGAGQDLLVGEEHRSGSRWPDLADTHGRLSPAALRDALPQSGGLTVLSWDRGPVRRPAAGAVRSVVEAGRRAHDMVVADVARSLDPAGDEVLEVAGTVLLVVHADVRGVAAACRVADVLRLVVDDLRLVVRRPGRGGLDPEQVAGAVDSEVVGVVRDELGVRQGVDEGIGPLARGSRLRRAAGRILDVLDDGGRP